jgi:hypothetical protein
VSSGGAWSAELYKDYLTDSTNFRLYIGEHNEDANFDYHCSGDSIIVRGFKWEERHTSSTRLSERIFRLSVLRREKKMIKVLSK